ncbi:MAG: hypothetical protein VW270_09210 [Candidatus Poseidoniales archaeon]
MSKKIVECPVCYDPIIVTFENGFSRVFKTCDCKIGDAKDDTN